jgi:eukaryotic-like serine/threonine-protein kinase
VKAMKKRACPLCGTLIPASSNSCPVCALHGALNFTGTISASSVELGSSTSRLQFEHYEILRRQDGSPLELGHGAMGVTYKAIDLNLRCPVALKVIKAQFIGEEPARRRFVREARAAASVRHPNVASVFHLGMTGSGYFYAMEFVDGKTVRELIENFNRLEPSLAIEIVKQVAAGLVAIEKQNLVHRDIKPSNIMISLEDGRLQGVKIIDLGLAKPVNQAAETASLSVPGSFAGTPGYASPEQFSGLGADIRSDLYSLGVTLWEMLTGDLPFKGSVPELMHRHQHAALPREKLTGLPPSISALLEVLLEKDPAQRFQSPADLIKVIPTVEAAIDSRSRITPDRLRSVGKESIKGRGTTPKSLGKRGSNARRLGWIGGGLIAVIGSLLVVDWFFPFPAFHSRNSAADSVEKSIAVLPFESLSASQDDAYFADGIQDEILSKLSKVSQLRVISRTSVMQYRRGERQDLRSIANALGVTNIVEGTISRAGQRVRVTTELIDAQKDKTLWSETYDRELPDIFAIQNDVAEQIAVALRGKLTFDEQAALQIAPTHNLAAYDLYLRGWALYQLYRQEENEKAIDLFKQALASDPKFALAYTGLASAYVERVARFHSEESWIDSAINLCRQAIMLDPKEVRGYTELAHALQYKRLAKEAFEPIRKALELDPNDWRANLFAAEELAGTRRYEERYTYLRRSFAANPTDTHAPNSIGYLWWTLGDTDRAEKWIQRAVDLESDAERHLMMESERLVMRGDYAAALPLLRQLPSDFFAADIWVASALLVDCYYHLKDWTEMLGVTDKMRNYQFGAVPFLARAIALRHLGQEAEAMQSALECARLAQLDLVAQKSDSNYWNEWLLACSLKFQGRSEEAYEYLHASFAHGDVFSMLIPDTPHFEIFQSDSEFQVLLAARGKENVQVRAKIRAIEDNYQ